MKNSILRNLIPLRIFPHIAFTYSPFKILEFGALMENADISGDERVLDIGCGDGLHTLLIGRSVGHITGIDVNADFVATARSYAEKMGSRVQADFLAEPLEKIQFPDDHFDLIFSICVIEHIDNYRQVLEECFRILKPGGRILFTADTLENISDAALVQKHRRDHHVVQYFRSGTISDLLTGIGFRVLTLENLFRSPLATQLFTRGIREGFNFGRLKAPWLARNLARAEAGIPKEDPGIFLLVKAEKPV